MAIDTRRCFWFGTEERAGWFATPLKGAESTPSAWGVDGTLLNGGGYGFNSFGSHKRYTYEWPQSSSPETAQMMKSYRDGTYGRGLLYFLEPGIYRTNILPAHWADPSMSVNNEAPSLVYGIDPIGVPTSGGSGLQLPIVSAQYDLSSTPPQAVPTPDSSVFLPIPTGHTLFLGAFYSATGSGGVFATPVNNNGTLGTAVKLTEKPNTDADVVTDQFSGDISGVRLWVGRETGVTSTVTVSAMSGRLMETSEVVTYSPWTTIETNLSPNPRTAPSGTTVGASSNLTNATVVQGATIPGGASPAGITQASAVIPSGNAATAIVLTNLDGLVATGPARYTRILVKSTVTSQIRLRPQGGAASFVALPADTWVPFSVSVPDLTNTELTWQKSPVGAFSTSDRLFWTEIMAGGDVPYFDGDSIFSELERTRWESATNASSSLKEIRTRSGSPAKQDKLLQGPWVGGQGHSGCRFLGTPSYVSNGPVEGGRVGFAASFVEVGSWVYG